MGQDSATTSRSRLRFNFCWWGARDRVEWPVLGEQIDYLTAATRPNPATESFSPKLPLIRHGCRKAAVAGGLVISKLSIYSKPLF